MTDQIADMLIRIKNAYMARKNNVMVAASKMNAALAQVLLDNKYLSAVEKSEAKGHPALTLTLNYIDEQPAMTAVRRVSKPGCRRYTACSNIPAVLKGFGINILSTSQGVMTGTQAKEKSLGGEILCEIW